MKKVLIIVLSLALFLGMLGCDPGINNLDKDELIENTVKIELFDYANETPELISLAGEEKPCFDFNKATLIATLDESYFEDILNDITNVRYDDFGTALKEPKGKTLVLYQSSGNMIVLYSCIYTSEIGITYYSGDCYVFDENGVFVEYIGEVGSTFFDELASTYFQDTP